MSRSRYPSALAMGFQNLENVLVASAGSMLAISAYNLLADFSGIAPLAMRAWRKACCSLESAASLFAIFLGTLVSPPGKGEFGGWTRARLAAGGFAPGWGGGGERKRSLGPCDAGGSALGCAGGVGRKGAQICAGSKKNQSDCSRGWLISSTWFGMTFRKVDVIPIR